MGHACILWTDFVLHDFYVTRVVFKAFKVSNSTESTENPYISPTCF